MKSQLEMSSYPNTGMVERKPRMEFSIHFLKHKRIGRRALYTVGIWESNQLRAICHVAPIDSAVAALRREMEKAGEPALEAVEQTPAKWKLALLKSKILLLKIASVLLGTPSSYPHT